MRRNARPQWLESELNSGAQAYTLTPEAVSRLKAMDFKTMWKLSDDYAYLLGLNLEEGGSSGAETPSG